MTYIHIVLFFFSFFLTCNDKACMRYERDMKKKKKRMRTQHCMRREEKKSRRLLVYLIWRRWLHDGTCMNVVVTEEGEKVVLGRIWKSLHNVSDISRGCSSIICSCGIWIVHKMLFHIWPKLCSHLPCALYPLQHLVWIHVSTHHHPALLSVHFHRFHSYTTTSQIYVINTWTINSTINKFCYDTLYFSTLILC